MVPYEEQEEHCLRFVAHVFDCFPRWTNECQPCFEALFGKFSVLAQLQRSYSQRVMLALKNMIKQTTHETIARMNGVAALLFGEIDDFVAVKVTGDVVA